MPRKENKKKDSNRFFGGPLFSDVEKMFEKLEGEGAREGGYSIQVRQTPEGTKVHAKIGKNANKTKIRKELERKYPGAEIQIEGGRPLIREISTKPVKSKRTQKTKNDK